MSIQTYSSTIRRKEMDAVLTCMVDEKTGPGELNMRLVQQVKDYFKAAGAVALRSPALALKYAIASLGIESGSGIMVSALAPDWQYSAVTDAGFKPVVLDVDEETLLVTEESIRDAFMFITFFEELSCPPLIPTIPRIFDRKSRWSNRSVPSWGR